MHPTLTSGLLHSNTPGPQQLDYYPGDFKGYRPTFRLLCLVQNVWYGWVSEESFPVCLCIAHRTTLWHARGTDNYKQLTPDVHVYTSDDRGWDPFTRKGTHRFTIQRIQSRYSAAIYPRKHHADMAYC